MTCGIYLLRFNGTPKVYIGQSSNIEQRFAVHMYALRNETSSIKLIDAYKRYGKPMLEILAECTLEELDNYETETIEIYDSVNKGFNTLTKAQDIPRSSGELNGRAKYTNEQVESVFMLLTDNPNILYTEVSDKTGVPVPNIRKIAKGENHSWLSQKYPEKYKLLISLIGSRRSHSRARGQLHPPIVSSSGEVHIISNVKQFAKEHDLDASHLGQVLKGKEKQHKGWKLYESK